MNRKFLRLTLFLICLANLLPKVVLAVDGLMIRVTAERGEIKDGDRVLATVPRGTRLWCFRVEYKDGTWAEVKVPNKEAHGLMKASQLEAIEYDELNNPRLQDAKEKLELADKSMVGGWFDAAAFHLEKPLKVYIEVFGSDHPQVAELFVRRGAVEFGQYQYEKAREYQERALDIFRMHLGNENEHTASALRDLSATFTGLMDFADARDAAETALALHRKVLGNEHRETAASLNNLGNLLSDIGDLAAARKCYEEALAIKEKVPSNNLFNHPNAEEDDRGYLGPCDMLSTLANLGDLLTQQQDYSGAKEYLQRCINLQSFCLGSDESRGWSYIKLGDVYLIEGNLDDAQANYEHASPFVFESNLKQLDEIGLTHPDENDLDTYTDSAVLTRYAKILNKRGFHNEAILNLERALKIQNVLFENSRTTADTCRDLAWTLDEVGRISEAGAMLDKSRMTVRLFESKILPTMSAKEQMSYVIQTHSRDWNDSLSFGLSHRNDPEIMSRSVGWLINGKAVGEEALAIAAQLASPEAAPLVGKLRGVRAQLAAVAMKAASAERDKKIVTLEARQQELVRKIAHLRGQTGLDDPWVEIDDLQQALPARGCLVNIARFEPYDFKEEKRSSARYVAWLIPASDKGEIKIVDLGEAEPIDAAMAVYRQVMDRAEQGIEKVNEQTASEELEKTLTPLADLIWKPLAAELGDAEELILSPDGALWLVPWAALPTDDGKFLLEKYKLRYVVSGRELVQRKAGKDYKASVVIADPDFDLAPQQTTSQPSDSTSHVARRSLTRLGSAERLPGTAREATAITPSLKEFSGIAPQVYLDDRATEQRYKELVSPRVVVLSTHGFFLEDQQVEVKDDDLSSLRGDQHPQALATSEGKPFENPLLRCGLLLAGCNRQEEAEDAQTDDGVLTGLEIVSTDLRGTDLVVLSACETGLGEIRLGEGVAGLRQAFQLAGAKSVVATLWQIPDNETAQLMTDFFVYLSQGQSKTDALRYAQLNRINEHRRKNGAAHPFYWAAFTLTGGE